MLPGVLLGVLSEHYGSPGRLAKYKRQFERISRRLEDDPSVFAIELETLARKASVDVDASVRLQLVRDRFIAGQAQRSLRRHLDSVGPDTPIVDIVDRCRVWESHEEDKNKWAVGRESNRPRAVCQLANAETNNKPSDRSAGSDVVDDLIRQVLPSSATAARKVTPIPSDYELLVQRLLGPAQSAQPVVQERSSVTDMEGLLRSMLPVASVAEDTAHPRTYRREPMTRCFSCGRIDHTTPRCPDLDESFPFLPAGWRADREDDEFVLQATQDGG